MAPAHRTTADAGITGAGCFLTVDLEDYKQTVTLEMGVAARIDGARTRHGLERLLGIAEQCAGSPHATLFATGQVARDQRRLIARLHAAGHEIACHSDLHRDVDHLGPTGFGPDLARARHCLEDATGAAVVGFRAPNFSLPPDCDWAFEALVENGFLYDSSLVAEHKRDLHTPYDRIVTAAGELAEFPLFRQRLAGRLGVRVIGGTYLRLLPLAAILHLMRRTAAFGFTPVVYLHPADLDDRFEAVRRDEMAGLGAAARLGWTLRQRQWSSGTVGAAAKLAAILGEFPNLGPMGAALEAATARPAANRPAA